MSLVWRKASSDEHFTFECPITGNPIDIKEYSAVYGPFLETLDGSDMVSYVDFFFSKSPISAIHWEFADSDCRQDFIDMCQDMGLMKDMKDICQGNWTQSEINTYLNRMDPEVVAKQKKKAQKTQKAKKAKKIQKTKDVTTEQNSNKMKEKIMASRLASVDKLTLQISELKSQGEDVDTTKLAKLENKLQKIKLQIKYDHDNK